MNTTALKQHTAAAFADRYMSVCLSLSLFSPLLQQSCVCHLPLVECLQIVVMLYAFQLIKVHHSPHH